MEYVFIIGPQTEISQVLGPSFVLHAVESVEKRQGGLQKHLSV